MGVYDSVNFSCPNCGTNIEVQSKAGDSSMGNYTPDEVPRAIAQGIESEKHWCSMCGKPWVVEVRRTPPATVQCRLVKPW